MRLIISDPVVVSRGPDSRTTGWGPYQFPDLFKLPDGRLMCAFADSTDTIDTYGAERGCCVSSDGGKTWEKAREKDFETVSGLLLDNGDRVQFIEQASVRITEDMKFPEPITHRMFRQDTFYRADEFDPSICNTTWLIHRVNAEHPEGITEPVKLNWPHMLIRTGAGVVVPAQPWGRLRKDPDGNLWMPSYAVNCHPETGGLNPYCANFLFRSTDNGHTWDLMHYLPHIPDVSKDPLAFYREGPNENIIGFAPDGTYIRLIRTDGGNLKRPQGPFLLVRSYDKGVTWEEPELFDDLGVWPQWVTLKCGATIVSYGRPGFYVRATDDPACKKWDDRIELIPQPDLPRESLNSCSYSDLIALDDNTAGLVYTDFTVKDEEGVPRKTILFRTIKAEM